MCRILVIKSKKNFSIAEFGLEFAEKCQKSKYWQGDGWGICWQNKKNKWQVWKSLSPIWKNGEIFHKFPKSKMFLIHARGASFKKDKNNLEYNQPFVKEGIAFLFNGNIIGMRTSLKIPGEIGSQKVFYLVKKYIPKEGIRGAIQKVRKMVESGAKKIEALNIGICDKKKFYLLCRYEIDENYYKIRYFKAREMELVCSEEIANFPFKTMGNGQLLII